MRILPFIAATARTMLLTSRPQNEVSLIDSLPPLSPNSKRIYLVRHGETDWNARGMMQGGGFDIELNANGKIQATSVAQEMNRLPIDVIVSSPLKRANETANNVFKYHPTAERIVMDNFREMRFGIFEGTVRRGPDATVEVIENYELCYFQMQHDHHLPWPGVGGESIAQVEARAKEGLHSILNEFHGETHIAIVAHSRLNKILLSSLLMGKYDPDLQQDNTCINVIDVDNTSKKGAEISCKPVLLNYIEHVNGSKERFWTPSKAFLRKLWKPRKVAFIDVKKSNVESDVAVETSNA